MHADLARVAARLCVGFALLSGGAAAHAQWTVTNLHPPGFYESLAHGVSGGEQVGHASPDIRRASLWSGSPASWVDLTPAGASFSAAFGVSAGQQVGYAWLDGVTHASLWSGTAASWVDLNPSGAVESEAFGVWNGAGGGQQVGKTYNGITGTHASLWSGSAASWVDLSPPFGASYSIALGVSDGQQVGWVNDGGSEFASLWSGSAASWVSLHPAGAVYVSHAFGVSGGRQVGRAFMGDSFHASLWSGTAASWVDLHPAGASESQANGVFGGQQVGFARVGGINRASLWSGSAASWVDLHAFVPAGFSNSTATSIWSDANFTYVAGYGANTLNEGDFNEALLWTRRNPGCDPDFTCDGNADQDDVACLIDAVAGNPGCECRDPDFNVDGNVDQDDVIALINVVAGGNCP